MKLKKGGEKLYQTEETMNKIYPIGNTGIYIKPNRLLNAVSDWIDNTPTDIKIKQMKQAAMIGLILSASLLILSIMYLK